MESSVPKVEIRTCLSANDHFMRMLHYFLESLQLFGGPIARSALCVVSVSRDTPVRDLRIEYPWISDYSVELRWVDEADFAKWDYDCTGFDRFSHRSDADVVVLADVDLLFAGDFDDVLIRSHRSQCHLGFVTHISPFEQRQPLSRRWLRNRRGWLRIVLGWNSSAEWWRLVYREAGFGEPRFNRVHTAWGLLSQDPRHRECPNYFNYGFIVAPRSQVEAIGREFVAGLESVDRVVESGFKSQIAHALAIERCRIPCELLSINDNFPLNLSEKRIRELNPDPAGADSAEDIRVFHYLGVGEIDKAVFSTQARLRKLLARQLSEGAACVFQRKLRQVHEGLTTGRRPTTDDDDSFAQLG